ncbi:hypothetical protein J4419_02740 [Candidatus Woesearchaeota archaeon]|nr:hypothetical protein [Candidatus Woesearchaeota archaeon]
MEEPIRIRAILEVVGKPKEFVESKLAEYIEHIKNDQNLTVLNERVESAAEKDGVWSTFGEIELIIKGLTNLVGFCIDYMPSSVDLIKPEKFAFDARYFNQFVNDMLTKLHSIDMLVKQANSENAMLRKNLGALIKNHLLVMLQFGISDPDKLSKSTGLATEEVKRFLNALVKEKRVKLEEGSYSLA